MTKVAKLPSSTDAPNLSRGAPGQKSGASRHKSRKAHGGLHEQSIDWTSNPHYRLWCGLGPIVLDAESLPLHCRFVLDRLRKIDAVPRHDVVLDDKLLEAVCTFSGKALEGELQELRLSASALTRAAWRMQGRHRGEQKVKLEDRLLRHLAEAESLINVYEEFQRLNRMPRQPYLIRQQSLSTLLRGIIPIVEGLTALRRDLNGEEMTAELFADLYEQEGIMLNLKRDVSRWRDNPSQKMTANLVACHDKLGQVHQSLSALKSATKAQCKQIGMVFYNRCGYAE